MCNRHIRLEGRPAHPRRLWVLGIAVALAWLYASNMDYEDARKRECAAESGKGFVGVWEPSTDMCKLELYHAAP